MKRLLTGFLTLMVLGACSAPRDESIKALVAQDRNERTAAKNVSDWKHISINDTHRRDAVLAQLHKGHISSSDFCDAATIFQRSNEASDLRLAFALSTLCSALEPGSRVADRLQATTWDRYMLKMGSGQWYATQFEWLANGDVRPLPIEPHLASDEDRARYGLPTLRKFTAKLKEFNDRKVRLPAGETAPWMEGIAF